MRIIDLTIAISIDPISKRTIKIKTECLAELDRGATLALVHYDARRDMLRERLTPVGAISTQRASLLRTRSAVDSGGRRVPRWTGRREHRQPTLLEPADMFSREVLRILTASATAGTPNSARNDGSSPVAQGISAPGIRERMISAFLARPGAPRLRS